MRYSKLFGKTRKGSKDLASKNATLLIRGGFIDQLMAGAYSFLPLGKRVLFKIENIIREEMDYRDFLLNAKPSHPEFANLNFKDPFPPLSDSDRKELIAEIEEMNLLYG